MPTGQHTIFYLLSWIWLSTFLILSGLAALFHEYRSLIPENIAVGSLILVLVLGFLAGYIGWKRQKQVLKEGSLFVLFLILGIGIGVITQLFDLPIHSQWGLLLWAVLSFFIVLLSHHSFLSFLWIPLFLGGILASFRFEFLLLFLTQSPCATLFFLSVFFCALIYISDKHSHPFFASLRRWSLIFLFLILLMGSLVPTDSMDIFLTSAAVLLYLTIYATHHHNLFLFNFSVAFLGLRTLILTLNLWNTLGQAGIFLFLTGIFILLGVLLYNSIPKVEKP